MKAIATQNEDGQAYARIRKAVGLLGLLIPILCISLSFGGVCKAIVLPSISHYYYTIIGDEFVAILFALGLVLMLYKSVFKIEKLNNWENRLTNLAGVLALIVAFIPTSPLDDISCSYFKLSPAEHKAVYSFLAYLHLPAAGLMLFIFGILSYNYFPRNWETGIVDSTNKNLYRICAWAIFISIFTLLVYVVYRYFNPITTSNSFIFIFEVIAILAFAVSWLKKGRVKDAIKEMMK